MQGDAGGTRGAPGDSEPGGRPDAVGQVDPLLDAVVARMGGARREGQHAMARAVAETMAGRGHLLVQAGTATRVAISSSKAAARSGLRRLFKLVTIRAFPLTAAF